MRLLVISNRLPFTVTEKEGKLTFKESAGGLVSGLSAYLDSLKGSSFTKSKYIWVGWPGYAVADKSKKTLKSKALNEFNAYPVFLSEKLMEKFYLGFCNKTIWPLFHYFPSYALYDEDYWNNYKIVNEIFCNSAMEIIKPHDTIWIHDYHLMLLPQLIREKMPHTSIGFFLHIPFPSYEIFQLIPAKWRTQILNGLLGANLIGFHTNDYTQHFLQSVLRNTGHENNMGQILVNDRIAKADTFPMGIDFQKFYGASEKQEIKNEIEKIKKTLGNLKVIISIDRLDYSKGILNRLKSYELFLDVNPEWRQKVILLLFVVPSRIGVEKYQQMKKDIDELVGKINGKFGSVGWMPILYQYKFLPFDPLVAAYNVSDIALITPLRDGMNLIAKEYIASRKDKRGVLILSEMAGAAKELGEAIIINPNSIEEIADALKKALEVPSEEQIKRNEVMQMRLERYDVVKWAEDFLNQLHLVIEEQKKLATKLLERRIKKQLIKNYKQSKNRLILLDYDGTLVPFADHPEKAKPDEELLKILRGLSENKKNTVVIISGRDKNTLEDWFGSLDIRMAAEHGAFIKKSGESPWNATRPLTNEWKAKILPILETYTDRLPGSFIEEKDFSLAWHYRKADPELESLRAKELMDNLLNLTANINIQVAKESKVIEIRSAGINKGTAVLNNWISSKNFDFMLALGDDNTDEDLFKILPEPAYSIKVGLGASNAKFNLHNYIEVRKLLKELTK